MGARFRTTLGASYGDAVVTELEVVVTAGIASEKGRLLIVAIGWWDTELMGSTLTGVDIDGTALTQLSTHSVGGHNNEIWYLPLTTIVGILTVTATFSDVVTGGIIAGVCRDVDLSDPLGVVVKTNSASSTPSGTVADYSSQDTIFDCLTVENAATIATRTATGSSQALYGDAEVSADPLSANYTVTSSRIPSTTGQRGDGTCSYTLSAARTWRMQTVRLKHKQYGADLLQIARGRP